MKSRWLFLALMTMLGGGALPVSGEIIRVQHTPPFGPGFHVGAPVDVNVDGTNEFELWVRLTVSADYPTSAGSTSIELTPLSEVAFSGKMYYAVPVGPGTEVGPELDAELEWVVPSSLFWLASRSQNYRLLITYPWQGVLGDPARPYLGIRFRAADGIHFGWLRFGFQVGSANFFTDGAGIVEWAYETEPDTPVTITPPQIPNDFFHAATVLTTNTFRLWSDNTLAGIEVGETNPNDLGTGASLWWRWTAPADGHLRLASDTGPVASVIAAFTGGTLDSLQPIAASTRGCQEGTPVVIRNLHFPVTAGTTYHLRLDSRTNETGPSARGEVHLQGSFATVRLAAPTPNGSHAARGPLYLAAEVTDFDGPRYALSFEANDRQMAVAASGQMDAYWHDPKPGRYQLRAVWQSPNGRVLKSLPVPLDIRPANDDFEYTSRIPQTPFSARASNYNASSETAEPALPPGAEANSVWWRWSALSNGIVTVDVPDGDGLLDVTVYRTGAWMSDLAPIASNLPNPAAPSRRLNHVQFAAHAHAGYAVAIRSLKTGGGSWVPSQPCDLPVVPGREFTFRLDFVATEVSALLVKQDGGVMHASFAAAPGKAYVVESSNDLADWLVIYTGVATGNTELLSFDIEETEPGRFFRLRLAEP